MTVKRLFLGLVTCLGLAAPAMAVDFPEVEANDNKAQANIVLNMQAGDTISGMTTGTSTTVAGPASADYFRVCPATPPFGVAKYCWRLVLRSPVAGHTLTIRGLNQAAGVPGVTDTTVQTGRIPAGTTDRIIQWYSFGRPGEDVYVRVTGGAATIQPYQITLECVRVLFPQEPPQPGVPQIVQLGGPGGAVESGTIRVFPNAATDTALDTDWSLFDQNLNAIPGANHDDPDGTGEVFPAVNGAFISPSLPIGRYYIGFANFNTGTNLGSTSAAETFRTGAVLDFPGTIANSSTTVTTAAVTMQAQNTGTLALIAGSSTRTVPFEITWFCFEIVPPTTPTNPTCTASANPATVTNDGTGMTLLTVNVTPGNNPSTSPHMVNADLTGIGGGPLNPMAEGPPETFTLLATVAAGTTAGPHAVVFTVTEIAAPNRTSTCTANVTVPTGACCVAGACVAAQTPNDCLLAGGVYQGNGTTCSGCSCTPPGAPANDLCADATPVAVPSMTPGSTCNATIDTGSPLCNGQTISAGGVWYSVAGTGNTMTASLCPAATFDSRVSVYCAAQGCGSLVCVAGNDDFCGLTSQASWCSVANVPYLILVHGFGAGIGNFTLSMSDDGLACSTGIDCRPRGACCLCDSCSIQLEADCTAAGGTYLGNGSVCSTTATTYTNTYVSTPNLAIPDAAPGVSDILNVPDTFAFADVSVRVEIPAHTFLADLFITLNKGGTTVTLWDNQCGGNNGMLITFSDAGVAVVCAEPTSGEYLPFAALNFGAETSNGAWTLFVEDQVGADIGTLTRWELRFNRTVTTTQNCTFCVADVDDGGMTGMCDGGVTIDDLLYYLFIFDGGLIDADVDDGSFTGTPDGGVTIDDLLYYLFRFDLGC